MPPQLGTLASVLSYSYSDPNLHDRLAHICKTKLYWAFTLHKHLFWTLKHHFVEVIPQGQQSYDMTILRTSHIPAYENVDPPFTKSTTASKSKDKCTKFWGSNLTKTIQPKQRLHSRNKLSKFSSSSFLQDTVSLTMFRSYMTPFQLITPHLEIRIAKIWQPLV